MAQRIQRKRSKGLRMPEGAVYVGRGGVYGNHFSVVPQSRRGPFDVVRNTDGTFIGQSTDMEAARDMAVRHFKDWLWSPDGVLMRHWVRGNLVDKDLACWCPLDQPCHADVLLELANGRM